MPLPFFCANALKDFISLLSPLQILGICILHGPVNLIRFSVGWFTYPFVLWALVTIFGLLEQRDVTWRKLRMTSDLIISILWIVSSVYMGGWIFFSFFPLSVVPLCSIQALRPFCIHCFWEWVWLRRKQIRAINSLTTYQCPRLTKNLPNGTDALKSGIEIADLILKGTAGMKKDQISGKLYRSVTDVSEDSHVDRLFER